MRSSILAAVLLAGCASVPPAASPTSIAGVWRAPEAGVTLSISTFSSFVAQNGCTLTGGMLRPVGGGRYSIERYDSGFASDACGPWRSGPAIAPFDGGEVVLVRRGNGLVASGGGRQLYFRWMQPATV